MDLRTAIATAVASLFLLACGDPGIDARGDAALSRARRVRHEGQLGGRVISTVDGEPITLDEVELVVRETGLTPLEALRRLQEERVLAAHAVAAGLEGAPEVEDATKRAAVQALIAARIEADISPASIPAGEVASRLAQERHRFRRPERRRASHLLARVPSDAPPEVWAAAERFIRSAIDRMRAAVDPIEEARLIAREASEGRSFRAQFEELPAVGRDEGLVADILEVMFRASELGVIAEPVRTRYGWHALVLQEIVPAWEAPPEEAEATIRNELCMEHRARRLDEIVAEASRRFPVQVDESAVRRLLTLEFDRDPAEGRPAAGPNRAGTFP